MCWVVASLAVLCLSIAIFWALQGAWVILPFAGLEVGLVAYFTLRITSNNYNKQVLTIADEGIRLEKGYLHPKKVWHFDRNTAEFTIEKATHSLSADKILIQDHSTQALVLGETLPKSDIDALIGLLQGAGVNLHTVGKTRIHALDETIHLK